VENDQGTYQQNDPPRESTSLQQVKCDFGGLLPQGLHNPSWHARVGVREGPARDLEAAGKVIAR
jgi:hypothetical protein